MSYEISMTTQAQNDLRGIFEYIAFTLQSPREMWADNVIAVS